MIEGKQELDRCCSSKHHEEVLVVVVVGGGSLHLGVCLIDTGVYQYISSSSGEESMSRWLGG